MIVIITTIPRVRIVLFLNSSVWYGHALTGAWSGNHCLQIWTRQVCHTLVHSFRTTGGSALWSHTQLWWQGWRLGDSWWDGLIWLVRAGIGRLADRHWVSVFDQTWAGVMLAPAIYQKMWYSLAHGKCIKIYVFFRILCFSFSIRWKKIVKLSVN